MNRRLRLWVVACGAVVAVSGCGWAPSATDVVEPPPTTSTPGHRDVGPTVAPGRLTPKGDLDGPFPVTKVVDGDTIWVRVGGDRVKVRLIGMDTAETVAPGEPVGCYGPEATAEATRLLSNASVFLETDPSQGMYDRYERLLAYVWLEDGRLFNLTMIRGGYAIEYTYDDAYAYRDEFMAAQRQAEQDRVGMWAVDTCGGSKAFE